MKQIGGRFLKKKQSSNTGGAIYTELNEKQAYEKIGHALRDMSQANKKIKRNGGKTTQHSSSLRRRKRVLQATTCISCDPTPQPSPKPGNPEDVVCNHHQQQQNAYSELTRSTVPAVHQKPFCQMENNFASGPRMPFPPCSSGPSADTSDAATVPPTIASWNSHSICMSPEEIGVLFSCLNSNKSTTSVSSVVSASICPSEEDFDALIRSLTRSAASTSSSCSLPQNDDPLEAAVGGAEAFPAPPTMRESVQHGDMSAFLDCLTASSSSTFSAVTFSGKA